MRSPQRWRSRSPWWAWAGSTSRRRGSSSPRGGAASTALAPAASSGPRAGRFLGSPRHWQACPAPPATWRWRSRSRRARWAASRARSLTSCSLTSRTAAPPTACSSSACSAGTSMRSAPCASPPRVASSPPPMRATRSSSGSWARAWRPCTSPAGPSTPRGSPAWTGSPAAAASSAAPSTGTSTSGTSTRRTGACTCRRPTRAAWRPWPGAGRAPSRLWATTASSWCTSWPDGHGGWGRAPTRGVDARKLRCLQGPRAQGQ
mmetsp:Transcript_5649/g.16804  ORF Transcript_5649/g.16804 Transcript_5649/m.16804 type:complete len:261 (+) Transcript_5649:1020-1802(+)